MTSKRRLRRKQCGCKKRHKTAYGAQIELWIILRTSGADGRLPLSVLQ